MVLLEAMSQGCAPVTFSFDGAACEMLTNNKSGYIINDDDIDGFACSLKNLMCNPEIRNTFSSNAILDASRFSVSRFVDTWDGIINML
jgi:glycosyltransferase involved in cell wall biosynthesis